MCYDRKAGRRVRPIPHCSTKIKNAEGDWITMHYNECGYRSPHSCGPKPPGTRRVVVMGASVAEGLFVQENEQFSARVERSLASKCGFPVEFQNMGSLAAAPKPQSTLIPEMLTLQPDAVLIVFAPFDLLSVTKPSGADASRKPRKGFAPASDPSVFARLRAIARDSRALTIAQHFMLANDDYFFRAYLFGNEDDALRVPVSPTYRGYYAGLESELREFTTQMKPQGIPLLAVPLPNRIQAALISDRVTLKDIDPWAFLHEVKTLAARLEINVVDVFPAFASTPHAAHLFYAVDGHPGGEANALIAAAVEQSLLERVPAFATCQRSR